MNMELPGTMMDLLAGPLSWWTYPPANEVDASLSCCLRTSGTLDVGDLATKQSPGPSQLQVSQSYAPYVCRFVRSLARSTLMRR